MKKIIVFFGLIILMAGCNKTTSSDIMNKFINSVDNSKGYEMNGTLEIRRNENKYTYDVNSSYKKGDYFKVSLINTTNQHQQIILKNQDGVFVLTPNLNKSFKFKSDWPYNNSQIYLLQPIVTDLKNDKQRKFEKTKKGYIFTTSVEYPNDKKLTKQKIFLDKKANLIKVEVLDNNNNVVMKLKINELNLNAKFKEKYFNVEENYTSNSSSKKTESKEQKKDKSTSISNDTVYPMYVPADTYLSSKDVVKTDSGERVIMTFSGESPFTLVQESLNETNNNYINGDPYLVLDTVGAITDESVMWVSNNIEYYVVSDVMDTSELLTVAESVNVKAVAK